MRLQASQDGVFHSDHERTQEEAEKKKGGGVRKIQKPAAGNTANKLCEGSKFFKKKRR